MTYVNTQDSQQVKIMEVGCQMPVYKAAGLYTGMGSNDWSTLVDNRLSWMKTS